MTTLQTEIQFVRNGHIYAKPKMFVIRRWNEISGTHLVLYFVFSNHWIQRLFARKLQKGKYKCKKLISL